MLFFIEIDNNFVSDENSTLNQIANALEINLIGFQFNHIKFQRQNIELNFTARNVYTFDLTQSL